jgi:hypothetical protein
MPVSPMSRVSSAPGNNYGGCIGQCGSTPAFPLKKKRIPRKNGRLVFQNGRLVFGKPLYVFRGNPLA